MEHTFRRVGEKEPLAAVGQTNMGGGIFQIAFPEPPADFAKPAGGDAGAIVADTDFDRRIMILFPDGNLDTTVSRSLLQSVHDGIFHQGLQQKPGNHGFGKGFVYVPEDLKAIIVPGLLDFHIFAAMFQLLVQGDKGIGSFQGEPHDIGEIFHHLIGVSLFALRQGQDFIVDGLQGIVQKVRIDLVLQRLELGGLQTELSLGQLNLQIIIFQENPDDVVQNLGIHVTSVVFHFRQRLFSGSTVQERDNLVQLMIAVQRQHIGEYHGNQCNHQGDNDSELSILDGGMVQNPVGHCRHKAQTIFRILRRMDQMIIYEGVLQKGLVPQTDFFLGEFSVMDQDMIVRIQEEEALTLIKKHGIIGVTNTVRRKIDNTSALEVMESVEYGENLPGRLKRVIRFDPGAEPLSGAAGGQHVHPLPVGKAFKEDKIARRGIDSVQGIGEIEIDGVYQSIGVDNGIDKRGEMPESNHFRILNGLAVQHAAQAGEQLIALYIHINRLALIGERMQMLLRKADCVFQSPAGVAFHIPPGEIHHQRAQEQCGQNESTEQNEKILLHKLFFHINCLHRIHRLCILWASSRKSCETLS